MIEESHFGYGVAEAIRLEKVGVGDTIKIPNSSSCWSEGLWTILSINLESKNFEGWYEIGNSKDAAICQCGDQSRPFILYKKDTNKDNKKFMSSIIDFYKTITASPDEKLLKKYGLEDPIGTPTEEGLKLSEIISYKKNREEVLSVAKQKATEDEKEK